METYIKTLSETWLKEDNNSETRRYIEELIRENKKDILKKHMYPIISFGTGGLRGIVGPGYSLINIINIQRVTEALCTITKTNNQTILIGYDHRKKSKEYAETIYKTAATYIKKNKYKSEIILFNETVPTPIVSFACKKSQVLFGKEASFGIMVTASHNPKEYNGVKVFDSYGCQIEKNKEKEIFFYLENKKELLKLDENLFYNKNALKKTIELYFKILTEKTNLKKITRKIVYTPLHGVGQKYIEKLFCSLNVSFPIEVLTQSKEDPEFSTLIYPNPEEGFSAFEEAIKVAEKEKADLIIATDPDVDRFGIAEKNNGKWKFFTGNEIATIFLFHLLKEKQKNSCVITAFTSSLFFKEMLKKEGVNHYETDPGFKNIGKEAKNRALLKEESVLFSFEESLGFMIKETIWEKDGIASIFLFYQILSILKEKKLADHLETIYKKYEKKYNFNFFYFSENIQTIKEVCKKIKKKTEKEIFYGKKKLFVTENNETTFIFKNEETRIIIRASGTEPKLKVYSDFSSISDSFFLEDFCQFLIQPEQNRLIKKIK